MKDIINVVIEYITEVSNDFKTIVINKPFVSVLFPASGFGASFIPDEVGGQIATVNPVADFILNATPYLRFIFLILTIVLAILSAILQIRKLTSNKDNTNKDESN